MSAIAAIGRRWQCRLGRHQWERCTYMGRLGVRQYERCFPCGKERDR